MRVLCLYDILNKFVEFYKNDHSIIDFKNNILYEIALSEYTDGTIEKKIYLNFGVYPVYIQYERILSFLDVIKVNDFGMEAFGFFKKIKILSKIFQNISFTIGFIVGKKDVFKLFIDQIWKLGYKEKKFLFKILGMNNKFHIREINNVTHLSIDFDLSIYGKFSFKGIKIYYSKNKQFVVDEIFDNFVLLKSFLKENKNKYHFMYRYNEGGIIKGIKFYFDFNKLSDVKKLIKFSVKESGYKFKKLGNLVNTCNNIMENNLEYGAVEFKKISDRIYVIKKIDIYFSFNVI